MSLAIVKDTLSELRVPLFCIHTRGLGVAIVMGLEHVNDSYKTSHQEQESSHTAEDNEKPTQDCVEESVSKTLVESIDKGIHSEFSIAGFWRVVYRGR